MDYEVFLVSRITEEHDAGVEYEKAVAVGLERTGRIVTAAALLISVVLVSFATSQISFIKLFGIGLTLAVLMDAFVIRGTLVPAFMRLAGNANWWAPAPLRRFHDRYGMSESVDLDRVDARAHCVRCESVGLAGARDRRFLARGEGSASDEPHVEPSEPKASERDSKNRERVTLSR
jgi:hypothetical protein